MANRRDWYFLQVVEQLEMDEADDALEQADWDFATDTGLAAVSVNADKGGIHDGLVCSTPGGLNIQVSAGAAYDNLGRRLVLDAAKTVTASATGSTTIGAGGTPTGGASAIPSAGNKRWVSLFLVYDRLLQDSRTDGIGATVYFKRLESFHFEVAMGSQAIDPTNLAPLADGKLLLGDFRITSSSTIDATSDDRRQVWIRARDDGGVPVQRADTVAGGGTPNTDFPARGFEEQDGVRETLLKLLGYYNDHVRQDGKSADRHIAADFEITPYGWIQSTDVQAALQEIVDDLGSQTAAGDGCGADLIGNVAMPSSLHADYNIAASTVNTHLEALLSRIDTYCLDLAGKGGVTQEIASAIQATSHAVGVAGVAGIGIPATGSGDSLGVEGTADTVVNGTAAGLVGEASDAPSGSGAAYGVLAEGYTAGVYGIGVDMTGSVDSTGVWGLGGTAVDGDSRGVYARPASVSGGGTPYGVYGDASGISSSVGVYGVGNTAGVEGVGNNAGAIAGKFTNAAVSGGSNNSIAVQTSANTAVDGNSIGVDSHANDTSGSGNSVGLRGDAGDASGTGTAYGVYGVAPNVTGSGQSYGVYGKSSDTTLGYGVYGVGATGGGVFGTVTAGGWGVIGVGTDDTGGGGVQGQSGTKTGADDAVGVRGIADSVATGKSIGVKGEYTTASISAAGTEYYGGYFIGVTSTNGVGGKGLYAEGGDGTAQAGPGGAGVRALGGNATANNADGAPGIYTKGGDRHGTGTDGYGIDAYGGTENGTGGRFTGGILNTGLSGMGVEAIGGSSTTGTGGIGVKGTGGASATSGTGGQGGNFTGGSSPNISTRSQAAGVYGAGGAATDNNDYGGTGVYGFGGAGNGSGGGGVGVYGKGGAGSGICYGVYGEAGVSSGDASYGVYGTAGTANDESIGVYGKTTETGFSDPQVNFGVLGEGPVGVRGTSTVSAGLGGMFQGGATGAAIRLVERSGDPSSPVDGDMWITTAGSLKFRANGTTYTVTAT